MTRVALALLGVLIATASLAGQSSNPVYTDDSPAAADALRSIDGLVRSSNYQEAVRVLQRLLDEEAERVMASEDDPDLFHAVRDRVHARLLATPDLLDRYRLLESDRAERRLSDGLVAEVERSHLLTPAGFEAALRTAQRHAEAARFDAAALALAQLEAHPDRTGRRALESAELLHLVAAYLDRPDVWDRVERWFSGNGLDVPARRVVEAPPGFQSRGAFPMDPGPALGVSGIPARPLWSATLDPTGQEQQTTQPAFRPDVRSGPDQRAWVFPVVVGDTLFVNDGRTISAWDRFTLIAKWHTQPSAFAGAVADDTWRNNAAGRVGRRARTSLEDTSTVTVHRDRVIATTGLAYSGAREGDPRCHAVDAGTGKVIWSVSVEGLDSQLAGSSVRGPALVEADTVVVTARKSVRGRRLQSLYLVGLDFSDGSLRWARLLGSAGALPFQRDARVTDHGAIADGVVYCTDQLGLVAAVEVATGRTIWVRRLVTPDIGVNTYSAPWETSGPVVVDGTVIALTPDRQSIIRLDGATGRILDTRRAEHFGQPLYLLKVGDQLGAIGTTRVAFVPLDQFATGAVRSSNVFPRPHIQGRVAVAGDKILVPLLNTVLSVDPVTPDESVMSLPIVVPGNLLSVSNQLVVVDERRVHSYLAWEVAEKLLTRRIAQNPSDPLPAVTYADLAFRAGHPERIAAAADQALAAIDIDPLADQNVEGRNRLFESLLAMVAASQTGWTLPDETDTNGLPRITDLRILGHVITRLGRAADTAEQRVAHLMALGRLREAEGTGALAVEAYQRVLTQPVLASATWTGPSSTVRAELEATQRIRLLLLRHGPDVYKVFDDQAGRELQALAGGSASDFETLARRYPVAIVAPEAWLKGAQMHERSGRPHAAISDLSAGLSAAEAGLAAGQPIDLTVMGEIGGRMVAGLERLDRLSAAAQVLGRLRTDYPELVLTEHGSSVDRGAMLTDLMGRLSALQRRARVGTRINDHVQVIEGWSILRAMSDAGATTAGDQVMLASRDGNEIALWGVAGSGQLEKLWSRASQHPGATLLRLDPEAAYLSWATPLGYVIERVDTVGGTTRWKTQPFNTLIQDDGSLARRIVDAAGHVRTIETPLDGIVHQNDMLVALDEEAVVLVERSGRAAAFDLTTGHLLWARQSDVGRVYDVAVGSGVTVIAGSTDSIRDVEPPTPLIAVYDVRSGQLRQRMDNQDLSSAVRWVRVTDQGDLIAGLNQGVISRSLVVTERPNWIMDDAPALGTVDAWIFGDRLFLLTATRALVGASLATGRLREEELDTRFRMDATSRISALKLGVNVAFCSSHGVVVFDPAGRLIGIDPLDRIDGLLAPLASESYFVTVETSPHMLADGRPAYDLHFMTIDSGLLVKTVSLADLHDQPMSHAILDGRIVVSAGNMTVVYGAN